MENRTELRYPRSVPIIFSPFSTQNWCPDQAESVNFSASGMFFVSHRQLSKGATLHIRAASNAALEGDRGPDTGRPRTVALAQVKWCKPIAGSSSSRFGVGVRYL